MNLENLESNIGGVSIRAIIVLTLILIFGASIFLKLESETLNNVVMATIGWYFGQKTSSITPKEQKDNPTN